MTTEIVIDTCCLINLCAVGDLSEWLGGLDYQWYLPSAVQDEALYLHIAHEDGGVEKTSVDLSDYVERGVLIDCRPQAAGEVARFVELARDLDDGEAMALAIAEARDWGFATDDKKALKFARRAEVPFLTTPRILKQWEDSAKPTRQAAAQALQRIETAACHSPPRDSALRGWWRERTGIAQGDS